MNGNVSEEIPEEKAQPQRIPILKYIEEHLQDGELPEDFIIEGADNRSSAKWAPGAMDGMLLYHMTPYQADEETKAQILEALTLISEEENSEHVPQILDIFEQLEKKASVMRMYDTFVRVMLDHINELNVEKLLKFGDYLISYGTSFMAVKFGLTLLSIFTDQISFIREVNLSLGAYDEFTWFAARYLSSGACKDGNADLFQLAKHVHGWGRIHAVNYLRPETAEISDWILFEGAENTIIPQYSADLCLWKAGALERLEKGVSEAEFTAIGTLLEYALDDGPCQGVSDANKIFPAYLRAAEQFPLNRDLVRAICDMSFKSDMDPQIKEMAEKLLREK